MRILLVLCVPCMEPNSFVPRLPLKTDMMSRTLGSLARILLVVGVGVSPLLFIPGAPALLGASKVFFMLAVLLAASVALSLSILRSGSVTWRMSPLLLAWWGVCVAAILSAVLSPALQSSFFGDILEIHTVGFLAIMGLLMTMMVSLGRSKRSVVYLYGSLVGSAVLLAVLQIARLVFGSSFLSLGFMNNGAANVVGSFNDLGLFFAVVVLVVLVTVVQLVLPKWGMAVTFFLTLTALLILMLVNFFAVWLILALFSLMLLMYSLTKDRFGVNPDSVQVAHTRAGLFSTGLIALVFVVSAVFLIGGSAIGASLSRVTGVSYLEIRPSVGATLDIMRQVYSENAFTGAGPNRFADSWQQYKDGSIAETIFWNTPFNAGSGYVPTWFVTTGLFGGIAWILFLGLFFYSGFIMLLRGQTSDLFWYFTGTLSFVTAAFIWIMSVIYVPGPTILILGAASTGVMIAAYQALRPARIKTFNLLTTARTGFVLIICVMVVIISSIVVGYGAVRQFAAAYGFVTATNNLPQDNTQIAVVTDRLLKSYGLYPSDTYSREIALYQLFNLNNLLSLPEATPADQQEFQKAITAAIGAGTTAVQKKSGDAQNWRVLGDTYAVLAAVNIEGASARANEAYAQAEVRDPKNPYYVLQKAVMAFRAKDFAEARRLATLSLRVKSNYTDALFLLSQIDIATGDVKKAITSTQSLISLESTNPGRYYQLGVLETADGNRPAAIAAFTAAVTLDQNYANARYLRALQYLADGNKALALSELKIVRDLNPDNTSVSDLMSKIEKGEVTASTLNQPNPISEPATVTTENDAATADTAPDTDLLKPVNTTKAKEAATKAETEAETVNKAKATTTKTVN